jgi:hypothetical protein
MTILVQDRHRADVLRNYRFARRVLEHDPREALTATQHGYARNVAQMLCEDDPTTAYRMAAYYAATLEYEDAAQRLAERFRARRCTARSGSR